MCKFYFFGKCNHVSFTCTSYHVSQLFLFRNTYYYIFRQRDFNFLIHIESISKIHGSSLIKFYLMEQFSINNWELEFFRIALPMANMSNVSDRWGGAKRKFLFLLKIICIKQNIQKLATLRRPTLHKICPYLELFWSVFSRIPTECGDILCISPYSVWMRENADQNNSEYEHFLRRPSLLI